MSRTIVASKDKNIFEDGHAFNLINDNGVVRIFDPQNGMEILRHGSLIGERSAIKSLNASYYKFWNTSRL